MGADIDAMKRDPRFRDVMLSLQKGLSGEVTPALRTVAIQLLDAGVHCRAYFDGEPSEEEHESMSGVETQLYADMPEGFAINFDVLRLDHPKSLPQDWIPAYRRKE